MPFSRLSFHVLLVSTSSGTCAGYALGSARTRRPFFLVDIESQDRVRLLDVHVAVAISEDLVLEAPVRLDERWRNRPRTAHAPCTMSLPVDTPLLLLDVLKVDEELAVDRRGSASSSSSRTRHAGEGDNEDQTQRSTRDRRRKQTLQLSVAGPYVTEMKTQMIFTASTQAWGGGGRI